MNMSELATVVKAGPLTLPEDYRGPLRARVKKYRFQGHFFLDSV
jgi:hypothetical protein